MLLLDEDYINRLSTDDRDEYNEFLDRQLEAKEKAEEEMKLDEMYKCWEYYEG